MQIIIPSGIEEIRTLYGDPRLVLNPNGSINQKREKEWRRNILTKLTLPKPIPHRSGKKLKALYVHKFALEAFGLAFERIAEGNNWGLIKTFDGAYNFRAKRGRKGKLSTHCWGIAVDLNRRTNKLGTPGNMPWEIIEAFEGIGFRWGGRWRRKDGMHFQAARGY